MIYSISYIIPSTLIAIIFLHYSDDAKTALEILGYMVYRTPCAGFNYDVWCHQLGEPAIWSIFIPEFLMPGRQTAAVFALSLTSKLRKQVIFAIFNGKKYF